jgi:type IV secretory pathway VirB2 component (pilin)
MRPLSKPSFMPDAETIFLFFAVCLLIGTIPMDAFASNKIAQTICKVANIFNGNAGKNVASLAIIIVGIGALMGKISAGLCLTVCVGIGLIFGSAPVVYALTGKSGCGCNQVTANSELERIAGKAVRMLTGTMGKALCTLGVIVLGLGALFGKVSWPLAVTVSLGIALIFGCAKMLEALINPKCVLVLNPIAGT